MHARPTTLLLLTVSIAGLGDSLGAQTAETPQAVAPAHGAAGEVQRTFMAIAAKTWPSVVTVRAYARKETGAATAPPDATTGWRESEAAPYPGFHLARSGSGFFIDESGDVLTCHHVLLRDDGALAELVDVELHNGQRVIVDVVGAEPTVNLAVLHTMVFPTAKPRPVQALRWGKSDALQTGQWMLGFGDPAGPEKFFAAGTFITVPLRDCYQDSLSSFFLQAAMVAHPEAYGGPIVDLDGAVVGILAPRTPTPAGIAGPRFGIEYALPAKIVEGLYDSLRQARSFRSPWLGFSVMSRAELAAARGFEAFEAMKKPQNGILIENVFQPSPAAAAGIQPGDFLCAIDDTRIHTPIDFQKGLYLIGIGRTVKLEVFRQGETTVKEVKIEVRPKEAQPR